MDFRSLAQYQPEFLLAEFSRPLKRTKIINTIGPKCESVENVGKLIDEGMNVARLNFSHGSHAELLQKIENIREAEKKRPGSHISILLDTKGPEIRTGINATNQSILLKKGQILELTTEYEYLGTSKKIACSYNDLHESTDIGRTILFADGSISSIVRKIDKNSQIVSVEILNDGQLGSKKNMCLPGTVISLPTITQKDQIDILEFGLKNKVDFIAISFARYRKDLQNLRKLLREKDPIHGPKIQLISKIENHEGVHNIKEIIQGSDGIMVARGDLGMEVPIQKVVLLQKYMTELTINRGKYVITATQLLESMENKPRPTRAEISDVTNAVLDLSDAVMTSGETANGQFFQETVAMMRKICQETQAMCNYRGVFETRKKAFSDQKEYEREMGVVGMTFQTNCDFIFLKSGADDLETLRRLSALRPKAYICAFSDSEYLRNATAFFFGVYCFPESKSNPKEFLKEYGMTLFKTKKAKILEFSLNNEQRSFSSKIFEILI